MAKSVRFEIELDASGAIKGVKNLDGQLDKLDNTAQKTQGGFKGLSVSAMAFANIASQAVIASVGAMVNGLQSAVTVGQIYESSLAELSAITGITGVDLAELGSTAQEQAKQTGVAIDGQIEAFKLLASNIDVSVIGGIEGLKMLGEETVRLSQASGVDLATASNTVASAINQFGLSATEAGNVVNVLAAGSKFGAAEVDDLGESLKNTGTVASLAGLSIETTVGALEVLSQNALKGAEAGTGLRNTLTILQSGSAELAELGITPATLKTQGLTDTLAMLEPILNDSAKMTKIFGRESSTVASILVKNAEQVGVMTQRVTDTNTALEQANINTNTFANAQAKLSASIESAQIKTFERFRDTIISVMDVTANVINNVGQIPMALSNAFKSMGKVLKGSLYVINAYHTTLVSDSEFYYKLLGNIMNAPFEFFGNYVNTTFQNSLKSTQLFVTGVKKTIQGLLTGDFSGLGDIITAYGELQVQSFREAWESSFDDLADGARKFGEELAQNDLYNYGLKLIADGATEAGNAILALTEAQKKQNEQQQVESHVTQTSNAIKRQSIDVITNKIEIDQQAINTAGISVRRTKAQTQAEQERNEALNIYVQDELSRNDLSVQSMKDVANAGINAIREGIQAKIAEAIATQLVNVIKVVPFPLNLAVLPVATAALSFALNKLIPTFERGGEIGGKRHSQGGTIIEAEQGEYIINRQSVQNAPTLIELINDNPNTAKELEQSVFSSKHYMEKGGLINNVLNPITSNNIISSITENLNKVSSIANTSVNEDSVLSAQISRMADAIANMKVSLSLYDLDQSQRQFNQVQIQGGVI